MTTTAVKLVEDFKKLDPVEQGLVWKEIAQLVAPAGYGPLTDEELTALADQSFVLLDQEEASAQPG